MLEASWWKWRRIQRGILDMGFAITDMLGAFQEYLLEDMVAQDWAHVAPVPVKEPDIPFYVSTVYRLELVEESRPLFFGRVELGQDLYYDEECLFHPPLPNRLPGHRVDEADFSIREIRAVDQRVADASLTVMNVRFVRAIAGRVVAVLAKPLEPHL